MLKRDTTFRRALRVVSACLTIAICLAASCPPDNADLLPRTTSDAFSTDGFTLVTRLVHISDTHVVDEESPARFPAAADITRSAWRPYESYSMQLVDGIIRQINRIHASGRTIDFVVNTGDACDNSQRNELAWLLTLFDGGPINPLTGIDDRLPWQKPEPLLDPHAVFEAQGMYQNGVHGDASNIPWYVVFGNHDSFAIGLFPIFQGPDGVRGAPLPGRGLGAPLLPTDLKPTAALANGNVTPGMPGPPNLFEIPRFVFPNPDREYFDKREFIAAMFTAKTGPSGHGFTDPVFGESWWSQTPVAGVRLIGLDTCDPAHRIPGFLYVDGSISERQRTWLENELTRADAANEIAIVCSHHPSQALREIYGSSLLPDDLHALLNAHPSVALHLSGHEHRHRVADRGNYVEIETCATIDPPQEGRVIEIYRNDTTNEIAIAYDVFSHIDDALPPVGDDLLRPLRVEAKTIADNDKNAAARQRERDPTGADPRGRPTDRRNVIKLAR
ncbi:MAG: metallophosphoesterase [Phycisphaerales bacterium]|nr:metallophosphoesterase [Phycisphaerales bacterium]MCB9857715.1 metallophosphoesterase [Phycisphaerales bacterium]